MRNLKVNQLLEKFQKSLKLDLRFFLKAGIFGSLSQASGIISGLIISYFFGHFASQKLFGDYNYILAVIGFLSILSLPGLDSYLIRSLGQKNDSSFIRSAKYKFVFSLIAVPILLGIAAYYFTVGQAFLAYSFIIAFIFFPLIGPVQLFNEFLTARKQFKEMALFSSLSSILTAIMICLAVFFSWSLPIVVAAYFLGIFIPSLFGFSYSLSRIKNNQSKDKSLLSYGLFMTSLSVIPWSAAYLGQIILAVLLGTEFLSIFIVAHKIPLYIQKNLFVFHKPVTAKLASQTNKQHLETLSKHFWKLILLGVVFTLPIYFLSPYLIRFIFTDEYSLAIPLAQLMSLSVIPLPLTWALEDIMVFQKIKKPQFYASFIINLLRVGLYFILIPIFKLYGLIFIYIIDRYLTPAINYAVIRYHNRNSS